MIELRKMKIRIIALQNLRNVGFNYMKKLFLCLFVYLLLKGGKLYMKKLILFGSSDFRVGNRIKI